MSSHKHSLAVTTYFLPLWSWFSCWHKPEPYFERGVVISKQCVASVGRLLRPSCQSQLQSSNDLICIVNQAHVLRGIMGPLPEEGNWKWHYLNLLLFFLTPPLNPSERSSHPILMPGHKSKQRGRVASNFDTVRGRRGRCGALCMAPCWQRCSFQSLVLLQQLSCSK